jgi:plasmid stabilization system protein ParE
MIGKKYRVEFKTSAERDLDELEAYLIEECSAPMTARRKFEDLDKHLDWLESFAELPAIHFNLSYQYGIIARTIPFGKKMAIIYTVENDVVNILRIVPQSMIIY